MDDYLIQYGGLLESPDDWGAEEVDAFLLAILDELNDMGAMDADVARVHDRFEVEMVVRAETTLAAATIAHEMFLKALRGAATDEAPNIIIEPDTSKQTLVATV